MSTISASYRDDGRRCIAASMRSPGSSKSAICAPLNRFSAILMRRRLRRDVVLVMPKIQGTRRDS